VSLSLTAGPAALPVASSFPAPRQTRPSQHRDHIVVWPVRRQFIQSVGEFNIRKCSKYVEIVNLDSGLGGNKIMAE